MDKRKKIIILNLMLSSALVGCSKAEIPESTLVNNLTGVDLNNINLQAPVNFEVEDLVDKYGFAKIKGYKNLEFFDVKDDIRNSKYICLSSAEDKKLSYPDDYYIEANKIKSLLGDDTELIKHELPSGAPELYVVKGYEEDLNEDNLEQRYIYLNLQEKYDEEYGAPYPEKVSFNASSSDSEKALKSMLSMEDKIKTMLNNLLNKEESDEVLRFLKEEISRISINPEEESSFSITMNEDMHLEYIYYYNEDENVYYNRFSFSCQGTLRD
ncbi:MAG: hypothetical protein IJ086_04045 [Clostridium sp.]|nr:hypothetical protein [Clostridium sp.]